jgi:hypothetical protein
MRRRGVRFPAHAVVGHRQLGTAGGRGDADPAGGRARVPQDVGDGLPDHPAEGRVGGDGGRQGVGGVDDRDDPGGPQRLLGAGQLVGEAVAAVAGDGLANLGERLPPDPLDVRRVGATASGSRDPIRRTASALTTISDRE